MLFSTLWDYKNSTKTTIGFTLLELVYEVKAILPIECEIPSLKLATKLFPNTTETK